MECRLFLDVVVRKSSPIFELLSGKDQSLLIWGDSLLVLNLALDVVDGIRRLDLKSDGLAGEGLDEDLHFGDVFDVTVMDMCIGKRS